MYLQRFLLVWIALPVWAHADAGEDITISYMLKNISQVLPPLLQAIFALIAIMGIIFLVQGFLRLAKLGKDPQIRVSGIVARVLVGICFMFPLMSVGIFGTAIFGEEDTSFMKKQIEDSGTRGGDKINRCLQSGACSEY